MSTKRMVCLALLSSIALAVYVAESHIPPAIPVPGVKLGLSNIMTLYAMSVFGKREAALVLSARLFLGSVFSGSVSAFIFSAAGGVLAFASMALLVSRLGKERLWVVSAVAAVAHNIGQLAAAVLVTGTPGILIWAPALFASGIATGVFTGICAGYLIKALDKIVTGI